MELAIPLLPRLVPMDITAFVQAAEIEDFGEMMLFLMVKEPWAMAVLGKQLSLQRGSFPRASPKGTERADILCNAFHCTLHKCIRMLRLKRRTICYERRMLYGHRGVLAWGLLAAARRLGFLAKPRGVTRKGRVCCAGREFWLDPSPSKFRRFVAKASTFPLEFAAADFDNDDPEAIADFCAQMRAWMFKHVGKTHSF